MDSFEDIIGQDEISDYFRRTISQGKVSHALILNGEKHTGKEYMAKIYASTLQCEKGGLKPCGECHSCKMAASDNHPDIITVTHENQRSIGVDDIRQKINDDIILKPYYSARKIYIVPEASIMTEEAQNALLKTLEEPPAYALMILLVDNKERMLPTILSRCVTLNIRPVASERIRAYLKAKKSIWGRDADVAVAFARGSIGRAEMLASSGEYIALMNSVTELLSHIREMGISEELDFIKKIADNKDTAFDHLDIMEAWYRDILVYKSTGKPGMLMFLNEQTQIASAAKRAAYIDISAVLDEIESARDKLNANVNAALVFELLLDTMKERAVSE